MDGGNGNDVINGVSPVNEIGVSSGRNEIDVLTGGAGEDRFIFLSGGGDGRNNIGFGPPYRFVGNSDYALITDFNSSQDVIVLASDFSDRASAQGGTVEYSLGASPDGLPTGTALFANNLGEKPDLIAILEGVSSNSVSLSEPYFQFEALGGIVV